jgi:hypothetical protein
LQHELTQLTLFLRQYQQSLLAMDSERLKLDADVMRVEAEQKDLEVRECIYECMNV